MSRALIWRIARTAAGVGIPLAWSNWLLPGSHLDQRGRTVANAAFATGYALMFGGEPNWLSGRGLRYGLASAGVVAAGYGAAIAIPALRGRLGKFADRGPEVSVAEWVLVHIPVGTVYSEEMVFRATLDPLLDKAFGVRIGSLMAAVTFGLWHIHPARAAGDGVAGSVAVTAVGGFVFGLLRRGSGSVTAPALLHLVMNAGGVVAPRIAARYRRTD